MTGILGSGFGIYGYLPAILQKEDYVFLHIKSKEFFYSRVELIHFSNKIIFISDIDKLLGKVTALVICYPPKLQFEFVLKSFEYKNIKYLFLEKPLSFDPDSSIYLLEKLKISNIKYSINYIFLKTNWFDLINKNESNEVRYSLKWNFKSEHFKSNKISWKKNTSDGGGVVRFYGIHIIAILVHLNYNEINFSIVKGISIEDLHIWEAEFYNPKSKSIFSIKINTKSEIQEFSITSIKEKKQFILINESTPFGSLFNIANSIDTRALLLEKYMNEFYSTQNYNDLEQFYQRVNLFWKKIEIESQFSSII
jgi:hypothetical protein